MILRIKSKIVLLFSKFGNWCSGSMLLEIAIGLSIFGIISGFFITKTITANRVAQAHKTRNNIEIVASALAAFLANNNRLPCPSANNDGIESDNLLEIGTVPYDELGIPQKNSLDGSSCPLIYVVDIHLTNQFPSIYETELSSGDGECFCKNISAADQKIKIVSQTQNKDMVAFVLDTEDNRKQIIKANNAITVKPSVNTFWVRRDMLLMQYLKGPSCEFGEKTASKLLVTNVEEPIDSNAGNDPDDVFDNM